MGFREIINSEAGSSWGNPYVQVNYQADNVKGDAQAYAGFLLDNGWVITKMEGDIPNGELELAAESASDGKVLIVTIKCSDTYSIRLRKTGGTLTRYTDEAGNDRGKVTETN